jgi:hypothetical protein
MDDVSLHLDTLEEARSGNAACSAAGWGGAYSGDKGGGVGAALLYSTLSLQAEVLRNLRTRLEQLAATMQALGVPKASARARVFACAHVCVGNSVGDCAHHALNM